MENISREFPILMLKKLSYVYKQIFIYSLINKTYAYISEENKIDIYKFVDRADAHVGPLHYHP